MNAGRCGLARGNRDPHHGTGCPRDSIHFRKMQLARRNWPALCISARPLATSASKSITKRLHAHRNGAQAGCPKAFWASRCHESSKAPFPLTSTDYVGIMISETGCAASRVANGVCGSDIWSRQRVPPDSCHHPVHPAGLGMVRAYF